jgi:hypothetical protein
MFTKSDLHIGRTYRPGKHGRHIVWMNDTHLRYDHKQLQDGNYFPLLTQEQFLKWANFQL